VIITDYLYSEHLNLLGLEGYSEHYYIEKLNSLLLRFSTMVKGYEMINNSFLGAVFGFGSGTCYIMFHKVFHNLYLQELFDNGIVFFIIFYSAIIYKTKKYAKYYKWIIMLLFLHNMFFDNLYLFVFSFFILVYKIINKNSFQDGFSRNNVIIQK
jgi:hypothetical protein